jgi:hypothetical protein
MPLLKKVSKKPAASAGAFTRVSKKPAAAAVADAPRSGVGRGDQAGTGIVTLTSKEGQAMLEKKKLSTIDLDTKLELLRLTWQGYC